MKYKTSTGNTQPELLHPLAGSPKNSVRKRFLYSMCALAMAGNCASVEALTPFDGCPTEAFLFQLDGAYEGYTAVYGVDLVTGTYKTETQYPTTIFGGFGIPMTIPFLGSINAVGFDESDGYIYGVVNTYSASETGSDDEVQNWNYSIVRLDSEYQVENITVDWPDKDLSTGDVPIYTGDVFGHKYYLYAQGKGLFKIDLSDLDTDSTATLVATKIESVDPSVTLADMAFDPRVGKVYAINSNGSLFEFDANGNDAARYIGNTGITGTFGAAYFDDDNNFYVSRNEDGLIFRINLTKVIGGDFEEDDIKAVHFADGPISSDNDGARCASAPLIEEDVVPDIDFGDAPDGYKTLLANNGARHAMDTETYLGGGVDKDSDGIPSDEFTYTGDVLNVASPSDDADGSDDEDGVTFGDFEIGLEAHVTVIASTDGILNAWFDWNRDGDFDDTGEHGITNMALAKGEDHVPVNVPEDASVGASWSRYRFSQHADLDYYGGTSSGEVEDHAIMIVGNSEAAGHSYYPSESGWVTLAYEDLWPNEGDYDLNDVVMHYRTVLETSNDKVVDVKIVGELLAIGGSYQNGFAVQLTGIPGTSVDQENISLLHNGALQPLEGVLENATSEDAAVFVISQNLSTDMDYLNEVEEEEITPELPVDPDTGELIDSDDAVSNFADSVNSVSVPDALLNCKFYRTDEGCEVQEILFEFELSVPLTTPIAVDASIDSLFDPFIFAKQIRGLEIHLVDHKPTNNFNSAYLNMGQDTSDVETNRYYRTANNLPWAIEINTGDVAVDWEWPLERVDILNAYPDLENYITEDGEKSVTWYKTEVNDNYIFQGNNE